MAFPGAILPAWGYHLRPHYLTVGNYFLAMNAGILTSFALATPLLRRGVARTLTTACLLAMVAMLSLSLTSPPVHEGWRLPGLFGLGCAAGVLHTAIFHAISASYRASRAGTINLAGAFFGLGTCLTPLLLAGVFHVYSVGTILIFFALIPGAFAVLFTRSPLHSVPVARHRSVRTAFRDSNVPNAVLLSLVLFFHFGNEWSVAGWLPLFLVQRLGLSPAVALVVLALYWISLLTGRLVTQFILVHVSRARLLLASVVAALFGCMVLTFTNNSFGAVLGALLVGLGFAPIYPLVVEKIGASFPDYHPGFFNGIFSLALTGGMVAPATLGYAAEWFGLSIVMLLPALGTFIVLLLVLAIWLKAKMSGINEA